ncbi:MAG TPA: nickel ABC transporter permease [Candidatus Methylomirabilis sp.]|nr:nickel ABC transporter permease [Candidatus Methylomirabilis sp.]
MGAYLIRRLATMVPVLVVVSVVVFSIIHLTPGDPVTIMLREDADPAAAAALRKVLGLDRPLPIQYLTWVGRAARGELGRSIRTNQPVAEAILERLPVTLSLAGASTLLALAVALPAGILSAVRRNSVADVTGTLAALSGISMPNFWLATLLIFLFSVKLGWLPPLGYVSPAKDFWAGLRSLILPSITLGTAMTAVVMRMTRSSLLEVLQLDFVRTARAKGLGGAVVLLRHALRNALIPVVTVVGLQAGALLGGAIITETIFALPGVGRLLVDAIFQRDFPIVQGVVLLLAVNFLLVNLLVDIAYGYLDPRIRYG